MKLILPIIMLLVGGGAGVGAGVFLKADPKEPSAEMHTEIDDHPSDEKAHDEHKDASHDTHDPESSDAEYVDLNNQFVVPVVSEDIVVSLVVLSLGVELDPGQTEAVYMREPKLRDSLLQVLFDHANIGGFKGRFTDGNNMDVLRMSLTEAARAVIGDAVRSVMITDIARQDV